MWHIISIKITLNNLFEMYFFLIKIILKFMQ